MEQSPREPHSRWARLRIDVNCGLRRGAWYPVVRFVQDRAVLEVARERLPVPRRLVQTIFDRPFHWTIVPRPHDAVNLPSDWGGRYAVCPACRTRAPIHGHPVDMSCPQCQEVFQIAWDEHYLRGKR
ncbi:MAG TPA: hypothetical protein VFD76_02745 [Gemmatimonadales bacterium]|nr:hypothetical protein [Gemmatimonadales bacterium]